MTSEAPRVDEAAMAAMLAPALGAPVALEKLSGGYSNITMLAKGARGEAIVRMPPPGAAHIKSGHDVIREARILEKLHPVFAMAPQPLVIIDDASVAGVPFFAMERVRGRVLRSKAPAGVDLSEPVMRALSTAFVDALAQLHAVDVVAAGITGKPEGYVQRQVDGWRERYEKSKTDEVSDMERLSLWLNDHVPSTVGRVTMVHNDFKYDNLVVDESDASRIVGVLDWELSTVGDPMTDLGTSLAYWIEGSDGDDVRMLPLGLTYLPGNLTRAELVARYEDKIGRSVDDLLFHVILASFKVAVIAQQIYYRFAKGFTQDPRFATLGFAVAVIAAKATRMLDAGRIDVG
ncbi:MAG TPA: phosphotransferase family protein [Myxococcota bacterium]|jgi:aminoglycoside phosphotransferase (APT) family kinase protein